MEALALTLRYQWIRVRRKFLRALGLTHADPPLRLFARQVDPEYMQIHAETRMARLFYGHQGRLVTKWAHYLPIYDRHLARFTGRAIRLLEIGVAHGGSIQLWRKYFGPEATIFGIDINPRCRVIDDADLCICIGSQSDPGFLRSVVHEMGGVDIVIDDGSHVASHQRVSFETLFPLVDPNGVYIVEDLHASYRTSREGGLRQAGTFIEEMKSMVDDIHAWYTAARQRYTDAHEIVDGIHFYDSIIVIEKRPKEKPFHTTVGSSSI